MSEEEVKTLVLVRIAILEERLKGMAAALELQAEEYKRRLEELNHAHARASEALQTYIPREVYEKSEAERIEWRRSVEAFMTSGKTRTALTSASIAIVLALGTLSLTLFNLLTRP